MTSKVFQIPVVYVFKEFVNTLYLFIIIYFTQAKELWEASGAVIMVVRRPGCLLCREVVKHVAAVYHLLHHTHFTSKD